MIKRENISNERVALCVARDNSFAGENCYDIDSFYRAESCVFMCFHSFRVAWKMFQDTKGETSLVQGIILLLGSHMSCFFSVQCTVVRS